MVHVPAPAALYDPSVCGTSPLGVASGNGITVAAGGGGDICYSSNAGQSWGHVKLPSGIRNVVWHVDKFLAYDRDKGFHSSDGKTWTRFDTQPRVLGLGAVASSPQGTLVGVSNEFRQHYENQKFYRSADGITWQTLPTGAFTGSHPINFIVWGYGRPSPDCPAPGN